MKKRIYKKMLEIFLGISGGLFVSTVLNSWFFSQMPSIFNVIVTVMCSGVGYIGLQAFKEEYIEKRVELKEKLSEFLDFEEKNKRSKKRTQKLRKERISEKYVEHKNVTSDNTKSKKEYSETKNYYALIGYYAEKNQIIYLGEELCFKINQFLNFVTTRYFKELQTYKLEDKIIVLLLEQIFLNFKYQKENTRYLEFSSDYTITSVLDGCFFLPQNLKEKIKAEYPSYIGKHFNNKQHPMENFNAYAWYDVLNDLEFFAKLVNTMKVHIIGFLDSESVENFENIDWDLPILRELAFEIFENCGVEFFGYENLDESVFDMLSRLIVEISLYVVLNNKKHVGCIEMLNSLKNCEGFLPIDVKMKVIDKLCIKYNIINHPYHKTVTQQVVNDNLNNVIQFPGKSKK